MQTKQCQICGKTFMPRRNNQKYCSAHCQKVAQKALERLWRQQHNDGDYVDGHRKKLTICKRCGKQEMRDPRAKFCRECYKQVRREILAKIKAQIAAERAEHPAATRAARPPVLKNTKCLHCGKMFRQSFVNEKFCSDKCRLKYFQVSPLWRAI